MGGYYAELNVNLNVNNYTRNTSPKKKKPSKTSQLLLEGPKAKVAQNPKSSSNKYGRKVSGLILSSASLANSAVGNYTGNKVRQSNINTGITIAGLAVSAVSNPVLAGVVAATYSIKRSIDINIDRINSEQESAYRSSYRGKATTSGSRWG